MDCVGVDLGLKGGIGFVSREDTAVGIPMPTIDSEYDLTSILEILAHWQGHAQEPLAFVEKALLHPTAGKKAWQSLGRAEGMFQAVFHCLGIPYTFVHPKTWQKKMHRGIRAKTPKKKSLVMAKRYGFPTDHEGVMEALLIAQYGHEGG